MASHLDFLRRPMQPYFHRPQIPDQRAPDSGARVFSHRVSQLPVEVQARQSENYSNQTQTAETTVVQSYAPSPLAPWQNNNQPEVQIVSQYPPSPLTTSTINSQAQPPPNFTVSNYQPQPVPPVQSVQYPYNPSTVDQTASQPNLNLQARQQTPVPLIPPASIYNATPSTYAQATSSYVQRSRPSNSRFDGYQAPRSNDRYRSGNRDDRRSRNDSPRRPRGGRGNPHRDNYDRRDNNQRYWTLNFPLVYNFELYFITLLYALWEGFKIHSYNLVTVTHSSHSSHSPFQTKYSPSRRASNFL